MPHSPSRWIKMVSYTLIAIELAFYTGFAFNYNPVVNKRAESFGITVISSTSDFLGLNKLPLLRKRSSGKIRSR